MCVIIHVCIVFIISRNIVFKMIATIIVIVTILVPTYEQNIPPVPITPCPSVFQYEQPSKASEIPPRWYGVINLSTDVTLHSLWLNIVLDGKADILGAWIGDITTSDNIDYKIENTTLKITPGEVIPMRFFVQYSGLDATPKLQAIRLNGKEICNASALTIYRPDFMESANFKKPDTSTFRPRSRPVVRTGPMNNLRNMPDMDQLSHADYSRLPYMRPDSFYPDASNMHIEDNDFFDDDMIFKPPSSTRNTNPKNNNRDEQEKCGSVPLSKPIPLVLNGVPSFEGQWPWQVAIYHRQSVNNIYSCGGSLVSHRHVITAAHCVTELNTERKLEKNTLIVYLGLHNLRMSVNGVQIRFVENIIVHPEYNVSRYGQDLAILELREYVDYSDWVRPVCLWPENEIDLKNVIGQTGTVVGWGTNEKGLVNEELNMIDMPIVDQETCLRSHTDFFVRYTSPYTYCAGNRAGPSACNGDSGGGMVFQKGELWYLRGLVSLSVARQRRCDPSHYVVFTDLAKFLSWIKQYIYN